MATARDLSVASPIVRAGGRGAFWLLSWPLAAGIFTYIYCLLRATDLLLDGDTYWHIAAGEWILHNGVVPKADPFSHTMLGVTWTAHEWLSEVILAVAHQTGGWDAVVVVTALSFAGAVALLTRALLNRFEPIYALLFAGIAISMTSGHLLARPHVLAMPLLVAWTIELVRASEAGRAPSKWLLSVMIVWANLHGGFTLGLALAGAFSIEALLQARAHHRVRATARSWSIFFALALACSMATPNGARGILFTWQILIQDTYALGRITEWRSPDFHTFQPLELWILGGLAVALHQGLKLPPVRLILLLGLLHLSLKHSRYIELIGLLVPLFLASPVGAQWQRIQQNKAQLESADRLFRRLIPPAGQGAILASMAVLAAASLVIFRLIPVKLPEDVAPVHALEAVKQANVKGPVLNSYSTGGFLIYSGIAPFIDGRADLYGGAFFKEYVEAIGLATPDGFEKLLARYHITWTLLDRGSAAVSMLDHLPQWRRLYVDNAFVVHVKATSQSRP